MATLRLERGLGGKLRVKVPHTRTRPMGFTACEPCCEGEGRRLSSVARHSGAAPSGPARQS